MIARPKWNRAWTNAWRRQRKEAPRGSDIFLYSSTYIEITKQLHYNKLNCQVNRGVISPSQGYSKIHFNIQLIIKGPYYKVIETWNRRKTSTTFEQDPLFSLKKKQRWTKTVIPVRVFNCLSWIVVGLIPFHPMWILFSCIIKKWVPPTLREGSTLEHFRAHANMRIYCNEKETQHNRKQWVSTPSEHHNVTFFKTIKIPEATR